MPCPSLEHKRRIGVAGTACRAPTNAVSAPTPPLWEQILQYRSRVLRQVLGRVFFVVERVFELLEVGGVPLLVAGDDVETAHVGEGLEDRLGRIGLVGDASDDGVDGRQRLTGRDDLPMVDAIGEGDERL